MATILDTIMARKREEVRAARRTVSESALLERIGECSSTRGFFRALKSRADQKQPAIIAEVKRASPSKGMIHPNLTPDPGAIAL
ncbi:MAG: indole-3-glycerol-phosphate synthase TrpC, partial [Magnetococcales bacterium]|nr:indole-3-glycerol-phosphate synthase TrpC [Magnetococcales bacterium]